MSSLVQLPDGSWAAPKPEACNWGHRLVPRGHLTGWDLGQRPYWYCLHPDHGEDDRSRWFFLSGPQEPTGVEMNTADGDVNRPRRAE